MGKKMMLLIISMMFLIPVISAEIISNTSKLQSGDLTIEPYLTEDIKLDSKDFSYNITDDNSFNIILNVKQILNEFYWKINKLQTEPICTQENQYYSSCQANYWNFSDFESKNDVTKEIVTKYLDCDTKIVPFGICGIDYYLIKYVGLITDLDPSVDITYSTTSGGFFNQTQATTLGINLSGTNATGDYKYYVYQNDTIGYWNGTFGHNSTLNLQTRTAEDYNLTDTSLVTLWGLNGNVNDSTGVYNGTNSGATFSDAGGMVGQGANFDGSGQYIDVSGVTPLDLNQANFTINLWAKFGAQTDAYAILYSSDGANGMTIFARDSNNGDNISVTLSYDPWDRMMVASSKDYDDNEWHSVTLVRAGGTFYLYVDGGLEDTDATHTSYYVTFENSRLGIGEYSPTNSRYDGSIDDVRTYTRAFTLSEVQNLYELGKYHIEWNAWKDEGSITSLVPITSTDNGTFYQFQTNFSSSGYLINHSINPSSAGASSPPPPAATTTVQNLTINGIDKFGYDNPTLPHLVSERIDLIYGEMYAHNDTNSWTVAIGTQNVWVNLTINSTSSAEYNQTLNGFTFEEENSALVVGIKGVYKAEYYLSTGNVGNNQEYQFSIAVNNEFQQNTDAHRKIAASGDVGSIANGGILSLDVDDKINLQAKNNDGTSNLLVHSANVNLVRIGN